MAKILDRITEIETKKDETLEYGLEEKPVITSKYVRKQVSPKELMPNPDNTFSMKEDAEWQLLELSIKDQGINNDIIVYENPDKKSNSPYIILSGHRRWKIAIKNNEEKVPIKIRPPFENKIDELVFIVTENKSTRQQKPLDLALSVQRLEQELIKNKEIEGRRRDYIAEKLGMSSRSIHNYLTIATLPTVAQEWLREEWISFMQALDISKLSEDTINGISLQINEVIQKEGKNNTKGLLFKLLKEAKNLNNKKEIKQSSKDISKTLKRTLKGANKALKELSTTTINLSPKDSGSILIEINEILETLENLKEKLIK